MHSSRWRRHPSPGTSWRSDSSPGAPSRMRRPGRDRIGLPSKPGRDFCQDLPLHAQRPVVTPQLRQLLALGRAQAVPAPPRVQIGPLHPAQHRVRRDRELLGDLAGSTPASLSHLHHLLPELLGIGLHIVSLTCLFSSRRPPSSSSSLSEPFTRILRKRDLRLAGAIWRDWDE